MKGETMNTWQVCRMFGGWWRETIEFVKAPSHSEAIDLFNSATKDGRSGFGADGLWKLSQVSSVPETIRGVTTITIE
jgi:hypothetical protein